MLLANCLPVAPHCSVADHVAWCRPYTCMYSPSQLLMYYQPVALDVSHCTALHCICAYVLAFIELMRAAVLTLHFQLRSVIVHSGGAGSGGGPAAQSLRLQPMSVLQQQRHHHHHLQLQLPGKLLLQLSGLLAEIWLQLLLVVKLRPTCPARLATSQACIRCPASTRHHPLRQALMKLDMCVQANLATSKWLDASKPYGLPGSAW